MAAKNASQIKSLRANYVRFPLDMKPTVLAQLRAACAANNTTPTTIIKQAISEYIEKNLPADFNEDDWKDVHHRLDMAKGSGNEEVEEE